MFWATTKRLVLSTAEVIKVSVGCRCFDEIVIEKRKFSEFETRSRSRLRQM